MCVCEWKWVSPPPAVDQPHVRYDMGNKKEGWVGGCVGVSICGCVYVWVSE